jgi:hypothetical protein
LTFIVTVAAGAIDIANASTSWAVIEINALEEIAIAIAVEIAGSGSPPRFQKKP